MSDGGLDLVVHRSGEGRVWAAAVDPRVPPGQRLVALHLDRPDRPWPAGAVERVRVERIDRGLGLAFCRRSGGGTGAVALKRIENPRSGMPLTVQTASDPGGGKATALTPEVALEGVALIHLPLGRGVQASRRLGSKTARAAEIARLSVALGELPGGWILRRAAAGADPDGIRAEARVLAERWRTAAATGDEPAVLLAAPGAGERLVADLGGRPVARVLTNCREPAARAPGIPTVRADDPIGEADIGEEIEALSHPVVALASGTRLTIEPTTALVAIDVDDAGRHGALNANLEAAGEIARQLQLRNLAGMVVVDFLRLKRRGDSQRLLARVEEATADDPASIDVYGLTRLGLLELTRRRRGVPLSEIMS